MRWNDSGLLKTALDLLYLLWVFLCLWMDMCWLCN